jgi:tetratricopeptide (TPR) repeat protein
MSYPGNPGLAADIKQRILATFDQTLNLAANGENQEAVLGCDFILRLDPDFEAARLLMERLEGTDGPVEVEDMRLEVPATAGTTEESPAAAPSGESAATGEVLSEASAPGQAEAAAGGNIKLELQGLFETRQYQRLLDQAEQHQAAVQTDAELSRLVDQARSRLEAGPYIQGFLGSARSAFEAGNLEEADRMLARAKSLDPSHPALAEFEELRSQAEARAAGEVPPAVEPPAAEPFQTVQDVGPEDTEPLLATQPIQIAPDIDLAAAVAEDAAAAPPSQEAPPSMGGDSRITQLLAEGQEAFDSGDYQEAVDAWSRIFLIDIDHEEAARRIEEARKLKAEEERKVEEIFHEGLERLEAGQVDEAKAAFEQVLQLQPNHLAASEYLQKIDAGSVTAGAPLSDAELGEAPLEPVPPPPVEEPGREPELGPVAEAEAEQEELKEEILVPPEDAEVAAATPPRGVRPAAKPTGAGRRFLVIAGAVSVVAVVAGVLLYLNWDRFFRNLPQEEAPPTQASQGADFDPINRATRLHEQGKTAMAVSVLQRVLPSSPRYDEAQGLIAEWETPSTVEEPVEGPSPEDALRRERFLGEARRAYSSRHYRRSVELFQQASEVSALGESEARQLAEARQQLGPMSEEIQLFHQGEWERVLPILWRLREKQPNNPVVIELMVDAYYNLGVRQLQRGDATQAVEMFEEALTLAPEDDMLRRSYLMADTYSKRSPDLLYRTYVKYLPFR